MFNLYRVLAVALLAVSGLMCRAGTVAYSFSGGAGTSNQPVTYGFQFTPVVDIIVDSLGFIDAGQDGLATGHQVGIWDSGGSLLASTTVMTANSTLEGPVVNGAQFRFTSIVPVILRAGITYTLGAHEDTAINGTSTDVWYTGVTNISNAPSLVTVSSTGVFVLNTFTQPTLNDGVAFAIANFTASAAAPGAVIRTPPYDFFVGCNNSTPIDSFGSQAAAIVDSNPITGMFDVNVQALGIVASATGQAGVGVTYTPLFTGNLLIQTTVQIPPPSFDLVYATGIRGLGQIGVAGLKSYVFISSSPPVDNTQAQIFRSAITTPSGSIATIHQYNPAEEFSFSRTVGVTLGQQLRICAGVESQVTVTGFPGGFTMAKALYTGAKVLTIHLTPQ